MGTDAGTLLRERRKDRGLSLGEVASLVGVTDSYQSLLESGKRRPTPDQIAALAKVLDLSPDLLCVAAGRLPHDVERALKELAPSITSFARQKTGGRAFQVPSALSEDFQDLIAQSISRPKSESNRVASPGLNDVKFGKNSTSYRAHSYHTKIPPECIGPVIEFYTDSGDIVLDPFCGSGMTGVAALGAHRNAVMCDISPAAVHIATNYTKPCDVDQLESAFNRIAARVAPTMSWLYDWVDSGRRITTEHVTWSDRFACPKCRAAWSYWNAARDQDGRISGEIVKCPNCGAGSRKSELDWVGEEPVECNTSVEGQNGRDVHPPTRAEIELIDQANAAPIPFFTPDVSFCRDREMWRASHSEMGIQTVADFYTRRNLPRRLTYCLAPLPG